MASDGSNVESVGTVFTVARLLPLAVIAFAAVACSDDGSASADTEAATDTEVVGSTTDAEPTTSTSDQGTDASASAGSDSSSETTGETTGDSDDTSAIPEFSPGCGVPFTEEWLSPYTVFWGEETIRSTVMASGVEREFLLELPPDYDPDQPHPIVFTFHGFGAQMDNAFGQNVADLWPGAIAIYPQALANGSGTTSWSFNPTGQDASFFVAMVNEIGSRMCLDMNRVFVQGTSNGGQMSNFIACIRGDLVDGSAPAASSFPVASDQCVGPVPQFIMHGRNDGTIGFGSGEQVRDTWLAINGCSGEPVAYDPAPCVAWDNCTEAPVVWCPHEGGHDLPSVQMLDDDVMSFLMSL